MKMKLSRPNRNTSMIRLCTKHRGAKLSWRINELRKVYPHAEICVFWSTSSRDRQRWVDKEEMPG